MLNVRKELDILLTLANNMIIKGATIDECERVLRHSTVIIDAEIHGLDYMDYKASERANGIRELMRKYMADEVDIWRTK